MRGKGYPYRERKKSKTNLPPDNRPHVKQRRVYPTRTLEEKLEEQDFALPDIRFNEDQEWSRHEACILIDKWAEISWGKSSNHHKAMLKLSGHFLKLWRKQNGRCAVTGLSLYGSPGCGARGIGIDIINTNFGVRKGNIRLVSAPIAITRLFYPDWRTQQVETINPKHYEKYPIFLAVIKHIQWYILETEPFKNLPVRISFPLMGSSSIIGNDPVRITPCINFAWSVSIPKNLAVEDLDQNSTHRTRRIRSHYSPSRQDNSVYIPPHVANKTNCLNQTSKNNVIKAWKILSLCDNTSNFCTVKFIDDCLHFSITKEHHPSSTWVGFMQVDGPHNYSIPLYDPTIHIESKTIEIAKTGFHSLRRFLNKLILPQE